MKINWRILRSWHIWLGIALSLPLLIISVTGILMEHGKTLGLEKIPANALWLPGYSTALNKKEPMTVKAVFVTENDVWYLGTKNGLFILKAGQIEAVNALRGTDVHTVTGDSQKIMVATKTGVWLGKDNHWRRIYALEALAVTMLPNQTVLVSLPNGKLVISRDEGRSWENKPLSLFFSGHEETLTVHKLINDLHTGKAFLGKHGQWLWIDLWAGMTIFISVTGVYLWWRMQRHKFSVRKSRVARKLS
jgi:hypothetical protein